jgi:hypothetical protein
VYTNRLKDTKKHFKKGYAERKHKKMAKSMGGDNERAITKEFFPSVERRLAVNLNLSPKLTTIMTGHGNIRPYLHRLKIIGSPDCPCEHGIQIVDHLIFQCNRLKNERKALKTNVVKVGNWPVSKSELTNSNLLDT